MLRLLPELGANFLAPYLVYELLHKHCGDTKALMASIVPPLLWSLYELAKTRRVDALSVIVVSSIVFTVAATALGGSARMIQVRDALVTGVIGVLFLLSLLLHKPLIFHLARATLARNPDSDIPQMETLWAQPGGPRVFKVMTSVWGVGLVMQTALLCALAWVWPIGRYLLISPFIGYGVFGILMLWSFWYGEKSKTIFAVALAGIQARPARAGAQNLP